MLHIITGPPCSGKTTYVGEHAMDGDLIIDMDAIASAMGAPDHSIAKLSGGTFLDAVLAAREAAISAAMDDPDYETWIIDSKPSGAARDAYEALNAEIIDLDPGMDECIARAEADGRPEETIQIIKDWYGSDEKGGNRMERKYLDFEVKSNDVSKAGTFKAYFSTWDRDPDSYGDIIAPGAFSETIQRYKATNTMPMLLWGHDTYDPMSNIGTVLDLGEDEKGAWIEGQFDLSGDNPRASYTYKLVKDGRVSKLSFAYDTLDYGYVKLDSGFEARELRKLDLFEVSIVPIPANRHTYIEDVKAMDSESYEAIASKINEIADSINGLIQLVGDQKPSGEDSDEDDDGKGAKESDKANDPDAVAIKSMLTLELMKDYI